MVNNNTSMVIHADLTTILVGPSCITISCPRWYQTNLHVLIHRHLFLPLQGGPPKHYNLVHSYMAISTKLKLISSDAHLCSPTYLWDRVLVSPVLIHRHGYLWIYATGRPGRQNFAKSEAQQALSGLKERLEEEKTCEQSPIRTVSANRFPL